MQTLAFHFLSTFLRSESGSLTPSSAARQSIPMASSWLPPDLAEGPGAG